MSLNIFSMIDGPMRRGSFCLWVGLGPQDSRSYVQDFSEGYKWVSGTLTKIRKTTRPDCFWPGAWIRFSKKQEENRLHNGQKKVPNCQQHAATEESTGY